MRTFAKSTSSRSPLKSALGTVAAIAIAVAGTLSPVFVAAPASAAVTTSVGTNPSSSLNAVVSSTTTLNSVLDTANDLVITGYTTADKIRVVIDASAGTQVQLAATTNLTSISGYTLSTSATTQLGWTSSQTNANTALAGLKFIAGSSASSSSVTVTVSYEGPAAGSGTFAYYATNGHYYQYVSTPRTWVAAQADVANNTATYTFNGLRGYLATSTSSLENDFINTKVGQAAVWLGARRDLTNARSGGDNAWYWTEGPESGTKFFNQGGGANGDPNGTAVSSAYNPWNPNEPNGTGTLGESALQMVSGAPGKWNDLQANDAVNQNLAYVVEYGGMVGDSLSYSPVSRVLPITVTANQIVDANWNELNFNIANKAVVTGTGLNLNDKVRFKNVLTTGNLCVDAVVTTKTITNATIKKYDSGTGAGGTAANFEADVDISAANGFAEFQFDFFTCDTYGTGGQVRVVLKNVAVSAIDIDYYQWNELTSFDSYTMASDTKVYECLTSSLSTGTCPASHPNPSISSFPASMRFQGPSSVDSTIPQDQVIVNYGSIETFAIKFGRSASGSPNYFGVAFKAQPWGAATPSTKGATSYNITYNGNGSGGGAVPSAQPGVTGTNITIAGNTGSLTRTGYTFAGWNTAANGTGTPYAAGAAIMMPSGGTTLYAQWIAKTFTLTYSPNGGSNAPAAEVRSAGATANLSATTPNRPGYAFSHWDTVALGGGTSYDAADSFTMPGEAITLFARWASTSGSLIYDTRGGSTAPATQTGTQDTTDTITATIPTKSGYTFAGWNTLDTGLGTDYIAGSTYTYTSGAVTIYARWTPVLYTLTYNGNGATGVPAAGSAYSGQQITLSTAYPTRTGYTCTGWSSSATGTPLVTSPYSMPAANTTLYAVCTADTYTVSYNLNGGDSGSIANATNKTYLSNYTASSAGNFVKANHYLAGWTTSVDVNGDPTGSRYQLGATFKMPASNVTLYAVWVNDSLEISYNANGGTGGPVSDTATYSSPYTISNLTPTRTGYQFAGWTAVGGTPAGTFTSSGVNQFTPTTNVALVASWTPLTYHVFYVTGVPNSQMTDLVDYSYLQAATVMGVTLTKPGYAFLGWNTEANGSGTSLVGNGTFTILNADVTLYAQWSGNPYTLSYNGNGGGTLSPSSEVRLVDSSAAISSTLPVRTGYTFTGWSTTATGAGTAYAAGSTLVMPASDRTLFARWTIKSSALSFDANGGSGAPTSANYTYGDLVTISNTTPTKSGYVFTGWNTDCNGTGTAYAPGDVFSMPGSPLVLCARWATDAFLLTYDANGGAGVPNASAKSFGNTVVVTDAIPTRAGYSFIAWNTAIDGTGTSRAASTQASQVSFSMPASNVTLFAIWSLDTFTVYYNMNGGVGSVTPQPGRFGSTVVVSASTPTRDGYTFDGWNTDSAAGGTAYVGGDPLTIPANNVTLYAVWDAVPYTLTYDANGGSTAPTALTGRYVGDAITLSASNPNRTGYNFNGWNTLANGLGLTTLGGTGFVMPARNVTLFALWSPVSNQLIYNANGGSGEPGGASVDTGDTVTVSTTVPTRPGYNFVEWHTLAAGTGGTSYAPSTGGSPVTFTMPAGNLTLFAQWVKKSITLTYDLNGGSAKPGASAPASVTNSYDAVEQLASSGPLEKANSTFLGWNTEANGSGTMYPAESNYRLPDQDETLYAQWSAVFFVIDYNANGGAGEPSDQFAAAGQSTNLTSATPTLAGHEFDGWVELAQGTSYNAGSSLTMPSTNVTLLARFRVASVGGSSSSSPTVPVEVPVVKPPTEGPGPTPPPVVTIQPLQIKEIVFFKGDRSALLPTTIAALKKLIVIAKKRGVAASILVVGRVKETNDKSYDKKLSMARAVNVANYLKKAGLKGPYKIIAAGISPENRWVSRRAEITVKWNK